jgi:hypothetical protein
MSSIGLKTQPIIFITVMKQKIKRDFTFGQFGLQQFDIRA